MTLKPPLVLLVCVLLGAIAAEIVLGTGSDATGRPAAGRSLAGITKPSGPPQRPISQWEKTVLGRPLFSPDRRPAAMSVTADAGLPRLTGIIHSPAEAVAIFQPADKGKPVLVRSGDTVSGWMVTAISASVVDLHKDADRLVLTPTFGDGGGGVAKQQKPPPSRWEAPAAKGILRARWSNGQLQP